MQYLNTSNGWRWSVTFCNFHERKISFLHFINLSATGYALVPILSFNVCEKIWHTWDLWPNSSSKLFWDLFSQNICCISEVDCAWNNIFVLKSFFFETGLNTLFSAFSLSFIRMVSTVLYSSMNYFKTEKLDSRSFKRGIYSRSLGRRHICRKYSYSSVIKTFFDISRFSSNK